MRTRSLSVVLLAVACAAFSSCGKPPSQAKKRAEAQTAEQARAAAAVATDTTAPAPERLLDARRAFKTRLTKKLKNNDPLPTPPEDILRIIKYRSPAGTMRAYLSPAPKEGGKHPAIIWIAEKIVADQGATLAISFTSRELQRAFRR
ncbi:MAG: hypothetical protein HY719_16420 [Planctomycetes bacterium]|nr:hypothetical protein [Planctomycetota bacterium]